jgi:hypothetical protein
MALFTGLDLGQSQDPTALAIADCEGEIANRVCLVRHLQRWPLGTSYTDIADDMETIMLRPQMTGAKLIVDHTGVGRGVVDIFRVKPALKSLYAVTITGGDAVNHDGRNWRVPKKDLVGIVQVLLQGGRLKIAPALPEAETLVRELQLFQMKITDAGNETFGAWRSGQHDDLVLAVALACWAATHALLNLKPGRSAVAPPNRQLANYKPR